jgi:hypothetical protein
MGTTGGYHEEPHHHQESVTAGTPEVGSWPIVARTGQRGFPAPLPGRDDECVTHPPVPVVVITGYRPSCLRHGNMPRRPRPQPELDRGCQKHGEP